MIQLELRGWKSICRAIDAKDRRTAEKRLTKLGCLMRDGRTPVLNIEAYKTACENERGGK